MPARYGIPASPSSAATAGLSPLPVALLKSTSRLSVCFARLTQISAIWVVIGVSPPPPAVASTPSAIVGRVGSSRRASRIWRNRSRSQPSPHASTGLRGAPNGGNAARRRSSVGGDSGGDWRPSSVAWVAASADPPPDRVTTARVREAGGDGYAANRL